MKGNEQIQKQQQRQTPTPQLYIYSICTVYAQILCWYTVTTNVYLDTVWLADGHWAGRDLSLHGKGSAAFQHGWTLTIKLRVTVHQRWDSNQNLLSVPLHHQLQLPTRLLYQLPCITQRKVLRHCAVNLGEEDTGPKWAWKNTPACRQQNSAVPHGESRNRKHRCYWTIKA